MPNLKHPLSAPMKAGLDNLNRLGLMTEGAAHQGLDDYTPFSGDRVFGDDRAIQGGPGRFRGRSVMVIGHEKGVGTDGRIAHNFGMAHPEGYRKAERLMKMADHFQLPILTFVDTQGPAPCIRTDCGALSANIR